MIIFRYLSREILLTFLAVTLVLLLIFLSNQFVHYLGTAAIGKLSSKVLLDLMLVEILHLLGLLMPLCFFLAILLAYGRLYADGEMGALIACGLNKFALMKITLIIAAIVTVVVGFLSLSFNPKILAYRNQLLAKEDAETLIGTLLPGRFQQLPGKYGRVFYVEKMSRDKKILENIFLAEHPATDDKTSKQSVLFAQNGYQLRDPKTHHLFLVLKNGYRYLGTPGEKEYQIIRFESLGLRLDRSNFQFVQLEQDSMPTLSLWNGKGDRNANLAEFSWRISLPISVILLSLLALSLSEVKPRQGRYAKLFPAVLIYTIYANLLFINRSWMTRGIISPEIGLWWTHGFIALITVILLYFSYQHQPFLSKIKNFYERLTALSH